MYFFRRAHGKAAHEGAGQGVAKTPYPHSAAVIARKFAMYALTGAIAFQAANAQNSVFASRLFEGNLQEGRKPSTALLSIDFKGGVLTINGMPHMLLIDGDLTGHGNGILSAADLALTPFHSSYAGLPCTYLQFKRGVLLVYGDSNNVTIRAIATGNGVFASEKSRKINGHGAVFTSPDGILSFVPGHEQLIEAPGVSLAGATVCFDMNMSFVVRDSALGNRAIIIPLSTGEPEYTGGATAPAHK
jgi:hypothetical protein